jgi:hypothetical protein
MCRAWPRKQGIISISAIPVLDPCPYMLMPCPGLLHGNPTPSLLLGPTSCLVCVFVCVCACVRFRTTIPTHAVDLLSSHSFIRSWTCPTQPSTGCQVSSPIPRLPTRLRLRLQRKSCFALSILCSLSRGALATRLQIAESRDKQTLAHAPSPSKFHKFLF